MKWDEVRIWGKKTGASESVKEEKAKGEGKGRRRKRQYKGREENEGAMTRTES